MPRLLGYDQWRLITWLGVKFLLFLYCLGYRGASSQVRMLWEDHRNDLFINGFGERLGRQLDVVDGTNSRTLPT